MKNAWVLNCVLRINLGFEAGLGFSGAGLAGARMGSRGLWGPGMQVWQGIEWASVGSAVPQELQLSADRSLLVPPFCQLFTLDPASEQPTGPHRAVSRYWAWPQ